jgi:hypothetical protein
MRSKELKWVACSKDASWSASQERHLIFPGQLTTLCGCTASIPEVWRGNSLKPNCNECVKVLNTMKDLERPEEYVMTPTTETKKPEDRIYMQWKGTDACLDFYCDCGVKSHLDAYGAYAVKCPACGSVYEIRGTAHKVETSQWEPVVLDASED